MYLHYVYVHNFDNALEFKNFFREVSEVIHFTSDSGLKDAFCYPVF